MSPDTPPDPSRRRLSSASPLTEAVLVTGNPHKLSEARRICGARLEAVELDLPEIQSLDLMRVLDAKGVAAFERIGRALIVEESGLELAALNGFPGPLVKWMLAAVGADGLARTAEALGDPRATAHCALLFRDHQRSLVVEGRTAGRMVLPPRGERGFGWDAVFQPDGDHRTFGELSGAEKDRLSHRGRAWRELLRRLG